MDGLEFKYRGGWVPMTNRNMFKAIEEHFGDTKIWFDDEPNVKGDRLVLGDHYIEDDKLGKINMSITSWEWLIKEVMGCEVRNGIAE